MLKKHKTFRKGFFFNKKEHIKLNLGYGSFFNFKLLLIFILTFESAGGIVEC